MSKGPTAPQRPGDRCRLALSCLAMLCAWSPAARAQGPEQLEQLEPDGGQWQLEYSGLFSGSEDSHSLQALMGVRDELALGVELESAWSAGSLQVEGLAPTVLFRFSDSADAIGAGIAAQVEFGPDLEIAATEARLILEKRSRHWAGQINAIVRRTSDDGRFRTALTYGWGLSRSIGNGVMLGAEGSGQAAHLSGSHFPMLQGGHFLGPAASAEFELGPESELEIGLAYLRRAAGAGVRNSIRLSAQFTFPSPRR